ncbi:MAG TPA: amidohydrolase [Bacillota bacterium]|jgi:5-methylthioadenosine/S-adenosylhomocysteine deaminase|nr:amidohydrolase [Bacillota bacterium]HOA35815.1 amidohydrolase [Bacillota bacterium]HPZ11936.1 amidohydrolase [Bacillota bacterium]HQE10181.1 amidohydrolase [Bacillota bacterium]
MGKILFTGACIITMDEEKPEYFTGDLLIEGDRIAAVSERAGAIERPRAGRVIEGRDLLLMPGLVNTHGHAAMTLLRGYADDLPLQEWLEEKIWPVEENLTGDDVYWGTLLAIAEMLKGGTTTFTDMYFFMERAAEAAAEGKIRAVLSRGLIGLGEGGEKALREAADFQRNWQGAAGGRISVTYGPHAPYTCPPDFLRRVMDEADKTGSALQIHVAETAREVEECKRQYGSTPVRHLHRLGLFERRVIAAHCVHLDDEDIEILAEKKVGVAHNPGSNLKLGSGIAPAARLLDTGVTVGLGTDGASSNNNLDLLEEMRLAALLAKGKAMEPTLIPARQALQMATINGASLLGLADVGILKEGFKADLIALNLKEPQAAPLFDPPAHVVYAAAAADVRFAVVDGEMLVEEGRLTGLDMEKIIDECNRRAERLTGRSLKKP